MRPQTYALETLETLETGQRALGNGFGDGFGDGRGGSGILLRTVKMVLDQRDNKGQQGI